MTLRVRGNLTLSFLDALSYTAIRFHINFPEFEPSLQGKEQKVETELSEVVSALWLKESTKYKQSCNLDVNESMCPALLHCRL